MCEEIIPPVHFNLELRHKDKNVLRKVVEFLLDEHDCFSFSWEMRMLKTSTEYVLYIEDGCWGHNLVSIAEAVNKIFQKELV